MLSSAATRVSPPGITIQPLGVQAANTRKEMGRAPNCPRSNTGATPKGEISCNTMVSPRCLRRATACWRSAAPRSEPSLALERREKSGRASKALRKMQ